LIFAKKFIYYKNENIKNISIMGTFLTVIGYLIGIIWLFSAIFVYLCAKDEKKYEDGSWKIFLIVATFLFITAAYCGISAHMLP
jgi:hypothetical protein